jgi:hypothetical protein
MPAVRRRANALSLLTPPVGQNASVDYDAIANHFLVPTGNEVPAPEVPTTAARRLRDALEAIATIGWWSREAAERSVSLGHGFFDGYVWGRAAALGPDVAPAVVVAAFGAFNGTLLEPVYSAARMVSSSDEILRARTTGAEAGLRAATVGVDSALIARLADRLVGPLLSVEAGFRPLFGALQSLPVPNDPYGRLWRGAELFREHRGDGHLAACAVQGLGVAEMNVFTEVWLGYRVGEYSGTRGFSPAELEAAADLLRVRDWLDASGSLTAKGRAVREEIEAHTDRSQNALVDLLGSAAEGIIRDAELVTGSILDHRAAPADPRKRYAG